MANGHGGYRQPSNPAAHSGPGQLSQRTDGNQPGRISGQPFGEGAEANQLLRQADQTAGGSPATAPNAPQQRPQATPGQPLPNVFGPTQRPDEPITAQPGANPHAQALGQDVDSLLRAMYANNPHPDIRRLLERRDRA